LVRSRLKQLNRLRWFVRSCALLPLYRIAGLRHLDGYALTGDADVTGERQAPERPAKTLEKQGFTGCDLAHFNICPAALFSPHDFFLFLPHPT
jgi:hypothetical protein